MAKCTQDCLCRTCMRRTRRLVKNGPTLWYCRPWCFNDPDEIPYCRSPKGSCRGYIKPGRQSWKTRAVEAEAKTRAVEKAAHSYCHFASRSQCRACHSDIRGEGCRIILRIFNEWRDLEERVRV